MNNEKQREAIESDAKMVLYGGRGGGKSLRQRLILISTTLGHSWLYKHFVEGRSINNLVAEVNTIIVDECTKFAVEDLVKALERYNKESPPSIKPVAYECEPEHEAYVCKRHKHEVLPCAECAMERETNKVFEAKQTNRANDYRKAPRQVRKLPRQNGNR